jgi:hypothetical protein
MALGFSTMFCGIVIKWVAGCTTWQYNDRKPMKIQETRDGKPASDCIYVRSLFAIITGG